jgi:hypothetical protein
VAGVTPSEVNALKGDMSFVGPRALLPEKIEVKETRLKGQGSPWNGDAICEAVPLEKVPGYEERHRVRPGLTGIAQIYADRDIPRRHTFTYDALSIKQQTFWLDLKLIGLSCWITVRGTWEDRGKKFSHPFPVPAASPLSSAFPAFLPSLLSHVLLCHLQAICPPPQPIASPWPMRHHRLVCRLG